MSRDDGFAHADLDTGYIADPKVKALARRVRDPLRTAAYLQLHVLTILESWRLGRRVTLDDAAPFWWTDDLEDARVDLIAAGLLDADSMVPERSWEGWFAPAGDRRQRKVRGGMVSGLMSHGMTREQADAEADRRLAISRTPLGSISGDSPDIAGPVSQSVSQAVRPGRQTVSHARERDPDGPGGAAGSLAMVAVVDPECVGCGEAISARPRLPRRATDGRLFHVDCWEAASTIGVVG